MEGVDVVSESNMYRCFVLCVELVQLYSCICTMVDSARTTYSCTGAWMDGAAVIGTAVNANLAPFAENK